MSESVETQIEAALAHASLRAVRWRRISTIAARSRERSVYRIDLDTGRIIKARFLEDEAMARRLFDLCRSLPDAFAPVFSRHAAVLLEDWIEGEEVSNRSCDDAYLVEAGRILADLHATMTVAGQSMHGVQSTEVLRARADSALEEVRVAGGLNAAEVQLIDDGLRRLDPGHARVGLVHADFCGENMVIDRTGRLRVVDHEHLAVQALGVDLARAWYRWALPRQAWHRFRSAYAARAPFAEPLHQLPFWTLATVVRSAALRLRIDPSQAHAPLDRLRQMAVALGHRGDAPVGPMLFTGES